MGLADEVRGQYWRGRFKNASGKYETVRDEFGHIVRFSSRREAKKAADAKEVELAKNPKRTSLDLGMKFGAYVSGWYARQDLGQSTMQNYRRHIENHLLPAFSELAMREELTAGEVDHWEKRERANGYAESSIKTWRGTLHLILSDAEADGYLDSNPAAKRRGRGRRTGKNRGRGPEKVFTDTLGTILIAERAALLSGRDDEFVAVVTKKTIGMRFGELVGLETKYVRRGKVRIEWQLYELDTGELIRIPPKDDSHRSADTPDFLQDLLDDHIARAIPKPCSCHGFTYVFSGHRSANKAAHAPGAKIVDVARCAEVSTGTVSNVLNRPDTVPEATRVKVTAAIEKLGYVRSQGATVLAAHWRRSGFATWLFRPAATGWYPQMSPRSARPVPIVGEPWPGIPARGRGATARADACWAPVAPNLTPHGLRHTHKTEMEELGVPAKLQDDRMGHADGSVQKRYTHITEKMRQRLLDDLTENWLAALRIRKTMSARSPVQALDRLLQKV